MVDSSLVQLRERGKYHLLRNLSYTQCGRKVEEMTDVITSPRQTMNMCICCLNKILEKKLKKITGEEEEKGS